MKRLLCLLLLGLFACAGCTGFKTANEGLGYVSTKDTIRVIPVAERGRPVSFTGTDLYGHRLALPSSSPGATVLNVWWSQCAECRAEATTLRALSGGAGKIADFYGVDIRESGPEQARLFQKRFGLAYPSFYDPGGQLLLGLSHRVPYTAIPTSIVLDRDMRVAVIILGVIPGQQTMRDVVDEALAS